MERLEEALRECEELKKQREASAEKSGREAKEPRASTTDPEARVMKFADGGSRPGVNVQFASETKLGAIMGVGVTNNGTDGNQFVPMLDQVNDRYGQMPKEGLVDGGFGTKTTIEQAEERGCTVYAPVKDEKKQEAAGKDPHAPKKGDSEAVAAVASTDGDRRGQSDLQVARAGSGMGECPVPKLGALENAGAWPRQMPQRCVAVRDCT